MTIKPILSQKPGKHDKKDIQDTQNHNLNPHRVCINQISAAKSPSPQRDLKPQSRSRRSPHKRNKRDVREKCKSPVYPIDCATSCSSPHSTAGKSPKSTHSGASSSNIINNNNTTSNLNALVEETFSGYNSGDEHIGPKDANLSPDEWDSRDKAFIKAMSTDRGFAIQEIVEDGACLFRSISLQIYGDQDMHQDIRQQTMDYIFKNREYFAQFVTEDINNYVSRKRNNHVHGNHIEIQAISEIYNRPVELYCYGMEPINIFNSDQIKNGCEPLRLSYQRGSHYNAILNPYKFSVGEGLGLPGYRADEPDHRQLKDAVRLSEDLEIEQTMFEDKLKTTDWEATNEAIEEQIARESYLQWCRDMQKEPQKQLGTSSSTVTSSEIKGNQSEQSPNRSGGESSFESEEQFPSDEEHGDYGACSSSSKKPEALFYVQQCQRRRKRKRANVPVSTAGPSTEATTVAMDFHSSGKNIKVSRRNMTDHMQPSDQTGVPGPSKLSPVKEGPMSDFYQSLLQSSYSADLDLGQMTEDKMLEKALHMSRMDFMKQLQQQKTDSDPPSP